MKIPQVWAESFRGNGQTWWS